MAVNPAKTLLLAVLGVLSVSLCCEACDERQKEHHSKDGELLCLQPMRCGAGSEPVFDDIGLDCKPCHDGYFMPLSHWSNEMILCDKQHDCPGPELKVHKNGTAVKDRNCSCSDGYLPVRSDRRYGQLTKSDCRLKTSGKKAVPEIGKNSVQVVRGNGMIFLLPFVAFVVGKI